MCFRACLCSSQQFLPPFIPSQLWAVAVWTVISSSQLINTPSFASPRLGTSALLAPAPFFGRPLWGPLALFALLAGPSGPPPLTPFPLRHPVTRQVFSPSAPAVPCGLPDGLYIPRVPAPTQHLLLSVPGSVACGAGNMPSPVRATLSPPDLCLRRPRAQPSPAVPGRPQPAPAVCLGHCIAPCFSVRELFSTPPSSSSAVFFGQ